MLSDMCDIIPDSDVGWANLAPTLGREYRRWGNVGPTFIAVWDVCYPCRENTPALKDHYNLVAVLYRQGSLYCFIIRIWAYQCFDCEAT